MSIRGLVFPGLALSQLDPALDSSTLGCSYKLTCSRHDIAANFLPLNNKPLTHSLGHKINFMYAMFALAKHKLYTSSLDLYSISPNTNSDTTEHMTIFNCKQYCKFVVSFQARNKCEKVLHRT